MLRKVLRTAQNFFPALEETKNDVYHAFRRYAGTVHDPSFKVVRLLPRQPDDLFLDIGANRGQSIMAIRRYRPDATIVSFEPNPIIFKRLHDRFNDTPGVSLRNIGLGSAKLDLTLFVPSYRGFTYDGIASFARESAETYLSPQTIYFFNPRHVSVAEYTCHVEVLDALNLAPTFMKLDIEGFEYDALQGATDTLTRHEPILFVEMFWRDPRVAAKLTSLGYQEVIEHNGMLVKGRSTGVNAVYATARRLPGLR